MYEDMQYESNFTAEETLREKRSMNFSGEEHTPRPKKPKADKKVAAGAEETNNMGEKQHKTFDGWLKFLKTSQEGLETREAEIEDLDRFIPPVAIDTLKEAQDMVNTKQALCDDIK